MLVSVIKSLDEGAVLSTKAAPLFLVDQANDKPFAKQSSFGRVVGNKVMAFVPACDPTATSQNPEKAFNALASCYENTIMAAISAGAKTVAVRQLGVGRKVNVTYGTGDKASVEILGEKFDLVSEKGKVVDCEVWGDLFWTPSKTSMAAKLAIQAAGQKVPQDIEVVFVVPPDAYDEWDLAMAFD